MAKSRDIGQRFFGVSHLVSSGDRMRMAVYVMHSEVHSLASDVGIDWHIGTRKRWVLELLWRAPTASIGGRNIDVAAVNSPTYEQLT